MASQGIPGQDASIPTPQRAEVLRDAPSVPAGTLPAPEAGAPARPEPRAPGVALEPSEIEAAASELEIQGAARARLRVDEGTDRIVAQILDENNEVIRQIPPEELLRLSQRFDELQGLLFDEQI